MKILLNDLWHNAIIDNSSKILWIRFKFSRVKVCLVVGYSPRDGDSKE